MSNHNLFYHGTDGTIAPASSAQILAAAREVLAHRVRRGALLQSPKRVGEYLSTRLGHLDYEIFGLILVDQGHRVIECIDLFRGTLDGACILARWSRSPCSRGLRPASRTIIIRQGCKTKAKRTRSLPRSYAPRWLWWTCDYSITS